MAEQIRTMMGTSVANIKALIESETSGSDKDKRSSAAAITAMRSLFSKGPTSETSSRATSQNGLRGWGVNRSSQKPK